MRKKAPKKDNSERWLLTYSDLITLLMIFFIIMYASSSISASKYKAISDSFKVAFGGGKTVVGDNNAAVSVKNTPQNTETNNKSTNASNNTKNNNSVDNAQKAAEAAAAQKEQDELKEIKQKIDNYIAANNMTGSVTTNIEERGLVIRIQDALFFDSGKADVKPMWAQKLVEIGNFLKTIDNYIRIEGHTDNVPISNSEFSDNLDLSCKRASNVYRILASNSSINPVRLSAEGYGDTRPVADNNSEAGKAQNRRVDIVVINSKFNVTEASAK